MGKNEGGNHMEKEILKALAHETEDFFKRPVYEATPVWLLLGDIQAKTGNRQLTLQDLAPLYDKGYISIGKRGGLDVEQFNITQLGVGELNKQEEKV
jgi:hypothetical protein